MNEAISAPEGKKDTPADLLSKMDSMSREVTPQFLRDVDAVATTINNRHFEISNEEANRLHMSLMTVMGDVDKQVSLVPGENGRQLEIDVAALKVKTGDAFLRLERLMRGDADSVPDVL
jgi:hypothetical protein